jgi:hypothetical protein
MSINKDLLYSLVEEFLTQAVKEVIFESQSTSAGSFEARGHLWQLQLTVTRNEDDFMEDIVGEDIFES